MGSAAVVTDEGGNVVERDSYDAWGKRRNLDGSDDTACALASQTTRGFTNQEEIDAECLVNLNARLEDPALGRFMSADTIIPDPFDSQSYNRYSYVNDDPLTFTDPTGHVETVTVIGSLPSDTGWGDGWLDGPVVEFGGGGGGFSLPNCPQVQCIPETVVVTGKKSKTSKDNRPKISTGTFGDTGWQNGLMNVPSGFSGIDGGHNNGNVPNNADGQCIKATDGPVDFFGGGYDQIIGVGVGIQYEKWWIPSTGAKGTAVTVGGYLGIGANLGAGGGKVNNFGSFNGDAYRFVAETPIPYVELRGHYT